MTYPPPKKKILSPQRTRYTVALILLLGNVVFLLWVGASYERILLSPRYPGLGEEAFFFTLPASIIGILVAIPSLVLGLVIRSRAANNEGKGIVMVAASFMGLHTLMLCYVLIAFIIPGLS